MNVERFNEDAAESVVLLACLTEDRTATEQRSLLALAWAIDRSRMKNTVTNRRGPRFSNLVDVVLRTVSPDSDGGKVQLWQQAATARERMMGGELRVGAAIEAGRLRPDEA